MGKFRLKIVESSFSKDYAYFKYSTNGIFWKTIKNYEYDSLDEYCYMVPLLKKFTEVEHYFNKFKTLDDIVKFEEVEFKKVVKQNTQINHLKNESTKKRDDISISLIQRKCKVGYNTAYRTFYHLVHDGIIKQVYNNGISKFITD